LLRICLSTTVINRFSTYLEVANLEKKLTNEQLEYLRQCEYKCYVFIHFNRKLFKLDYTMNESAGLTEIEEIAKQWNMDDFDFCHELCVSIFSLYLFDIEI
jgi:hypothetical protein